MPRMQTVYDGYDHVYLLVYSHTSCRSVYSVLCIQGVTAQPKKASEKITFSLQVNTAAVSETLIDSKAGADRLSNKQSTNVLRVFPSSHTVRLHGGAQTFLRSTEAR